MSTEAANGLPDAARRALRWLKQRGGDAAVARVKGGGRIVLAGGEHAPFSFGTWRTLCDAGLTKYLDGSGRKAVRISLTETGRAFCDG